MALTPPEAGWGRNEHAPNLGSGRPFLNGIIWPSGCSLEPHFLPAEGLFPNTPGSVSLLGGSLPSPTALFSHLTCRPLKPRGHRAQDPRGHGGPTLTLSSESLSMVTLASSRWLLRATISWLSARFSSS